MGKEDEAYELSVPQVKDLGEEQVSEWPGKQRQKWWQIWRPKRKPRLPPRRLEDAPITPYASASVFSVLTFQWITPLMVLGYQRPLQATDLWKLPDDKASLLLSAKFLEHLKQRQEKARVWNETHDKKRHGSVAWALNDTLTGFWSGGLFKVVGDTAQLMAPLIIKQIIRFSQEVATAKRNGQEPPGISAGVGMAFGLLGLTLLASICQHQFFFRSMSTGVIARSTLITAIYQRSIELSTSARLTHTNGKLVNAISSDVSRIDYCAQWFHAIWTAPIQLSVCLVLLCLQLGPAAIVGFALFLLVGPLQTFIIKLSFNVRQTSVKWTDKRAQLLRELLGSMRIIKVFVYEVPFLRRLKDIRQKEMQGIRSLLFIRSFNQAVAFSVPTLAAVLSFVVYARTHNDLDPALIFTSLALFGLLRQPLMFLPRALSCVADAQSALYRLRQIFEAETAANGLNIQANLSSAIQVQGAFAWDEKTDLEVDLAIKRGELVAVIGTVGCGKSSLLQAIIGEMPAITGKVKLSAGIAYVQQNAWIQNASLRDNILFGQHYEPKRYWQAVRDASLMADLEILPGGDQCEIGEKGINLSGGQKQRVNIARALYHDSDIILLDDPLSAVDAHVAEALFHNAVKTLKARGATVLMVTHSLHLLSDKAFDRIIVMKDRRIVESGTHESLLLSSANYSQLMTEFAGKRVENDIQQAPTSSNSDSTKGKLIQHEARKTGSIGIQVYAGYLHAGHGAWTFPLTLAMAGIMQAAQVMSTVWITYWEADSFSQSSGFYEGIYAALGIIQALFTFFMGAGIGLVAYYASNALHADALKHAFSAPMSFYDTTPLGRILNVFGRDVDIVDNQLADSLRMALLTLSTLAGAVIIITVYLHIFIVVIVVVCVGYWYFSLYYRTSARELKRLDSLLRGLFYAHFSESLSGLPTIRAYGEQQRFIREDAYYADLNNRSLFLTTVNQRWLSVRLDALGSLIVFSVAMMAASGTSGISPSEIGLALTYMTQLVQVLGMCTRQMSEVENNCNSVERLLSFSTSLPQEADHSRPAPQGWPEHGAIRFDDIDMAYRPGLPTVLKSVSLGIRAGERIGVVGRTGSGKSSLTVALYRLCELSAGTISIDGIDIAQVGLDALRSSIAIIPQDPVLFSGDLRSNLDSFGVYTDAELHDAMKRSHLPERFTLDTPIADEGSNLSVGERSLVSLARALVKKAKIVLLDEATAAVDLETDARIQSTIATEFSDRTLICIAHRLRTILSWDRILVMDAGRVAEFDTPANLYRSRGQFFEMCRASGISDDDVCSAG